ncbi:dipeptide epimerase [Archangium violaceum]|uniref:N-acetyl-D-Glu racemase DgcA n=1 Tax=Archangium violaceum TaxID=83451 RepID=UPI002B31DBA6|nr:dipeptide epimerase [Archangium violaceum]
MAKLSVRTESWPIRGVFRISRGSKTTAEVVVAEIRDGDLVGRGECVPYRRYGETVEGVVSAIEQLVPQVEAGLDRQGLQTVLPAGAARNAVDVAFWDLEAKRAGRRVWELAGLPAPGPVTTAFTLSLGPIEEMAAAAAKAAHCPLLKLKVGGEEDIERVAAVRRAAPASRLIVDANEAWTLEQLQRFAPALHELGVVMIEQPLHADRDEVLLGYRGPVRLGADESCHDTASLAHCKGRYDIVNIKLDKTGGLTEALKLRAAAQAQGFSIMVGCMVGTSLAMAPAHLVGQGVEFVDIDGPLLLAEDRKPGLRLDGTTVYPPDAALWG